MQSVADESSESGLHWGLRGEHVLLSSLRLDSVMGFFAASVLTVIICLAERLTTHAYEKQWTPSFCGQARWRNALWRSTLYWICSFLRLCYMLIAMSFHIGLIVLIATTLSAAQFFVELRKCSNSESHRPRPSSYEDAEEPLLERDSAPLAMKLMPAPRMSTRPRSKSKPDGIFIHPQHNNIARADAAALELGLGGTTDRVAVPAYEHTGAPWQHDQGRQQARALLGQASDGRHAHAFGFGEDSDSSELSSSSPS